MKTIKDFFIFFVILLSAFAQAAEDSAFAEKARSRQYVGGADEDDLKVQQLAQKDMKNKSESNQEANEGF